MSTICTSAAANFSIQYVYGGNVFTGSVTLYDFNTNIGIGNNSSSLDMSLLYEGCNNISDQPTTLPTIGRLVNFTCNSFTFTGIVNSATYAVSENGFIFKIKLIDANKLLENVTILLKDYYCPIQAPNFINVANLIEGGAALCPPGDDFENWPRNGNCTVFGTSGVNGVSPNNGVSLEKVIGALNGQSIFTTIGETISIDLSNLVYSLTSVPYATVNNTDMSLMSIISAACDYIACDFFIMLEGSVLKVILIDRSVAPPLGIIGGIISTAEQSGTLINSENGFQEIYTESNKVIIGDKVSYLAERVFDANNKPDMMLGYDVDGKVIRASGNNFRVSINTKALQDVIGFPNDMYEITEEEIICAGSHHMWLMYGLRNAQNTSLSRAVINHLQLADANLLQSATNVWSTLLDANSPMDDEIDANGVVTRRGWKTALLNMPALLGGMAKNEAMIRYTLVYDWFKTFIDTYYGKKWLVPLSGVCAFPASNTKIIKGDTGEFYLSDVGSDAGYPSANQSLTIRGLKTWVETVVFETTDNRISGFVDTLVTSTKRLNILARDTEFKFSYAETKPDSFITKGNRFYLKMDTTSEFHINPKTNAGEILIHLDDMIPLSVNIDNNNLVNQGIRALATLFRPEIYTEMTRNGTGYGDNSTINILNVNNAAGNFDAAIMPLLSNIYVYGPWTGSSGPIGSTKVDVNSNLNPWSYGGYNNMATVGQALADAGLRASNLEESGSFSLAEPPGYSIPYFLNAGVLIDNINVTYSSSGVRTDYSFKTFSTKFGQYAQALSERVKQVTALRSKTIEQIRNQRRSTLTMAANLRSAIAKSKFKLGIPQNNNVNANRPSPGTVFVGGYHDINITTGGGEESSTPPSIPITYDPSRQEICDITETTLDEPSEDGASSTVAHKYDAGLSEKYFIEGSYEGEKFRGTAIMSMDAIVAPVSLKGRNGKLPRYYQSWIDSDNDSEAKCLSRPKTSLPPIMVGSNDTSSCLPINQKYLNPILSETLLEDWDDRKGSTTKGCNIHFISFGDDITIILNEEEKEKQNDFGFFALKGPLVLQSWGYDTNNKPMPNIVDSPESAENGIFDPKAKNKFMKNWLKNPASWPVGPIDLRFDRDRGVWVAPTSSEKIVLARLIEDLPGLGSAHAVLINPTSDDKTFYEDYPIIGSKGEDIGSQLDASRIKVYDFFDEELYIDNTIYAYHDGDKYIILEHDNNQPKSKFFQLTSSMEPCSIGYGDEVRLTAGAPEPQFETSCAGLTGQALHDISNEVRKHNLVLKKKNVNDPVDSGLYLEAVRTKKFDSESSRGEPIWTILRFIDCGEADSGSSTTINVITNVTLETSNLVFDTKDIEVLGYTDADPINIPLITCDNGGGSGGGGGGSS